MEEGDIKMAPQYSGIMRSSPTTVEPIKGRQRLLITGHFSNTPLATWAVYALNIGKMIVTCQPQSLYQEVDA